MRRFLILTGLIAMLLTASDRAHAAGVPICHYVTAISDYECDDTDRADTSAGPVYGGDATDESSGAEATTIYVQYDPLRESW